MESEKLITTPKAEKAKTLGHALNILNDAARESTKEIKGVLTEIRDTSKEALFNTQEKLVEEGRKTARFVNYSAHKNPWQYIGATAAVASVAGFLAGRKSKKNPE